MSERSISHALPAAALALVALVYLGGIGGYALQDPDEGRYAEIPREMIESGDWVTPRLNYVKYFEKPPLLYWLVAISFEVFGTSEGAARLPAAASGVLTIVISYLLGARLFGRRAGLIGAAVLATSGMFWGLSQALTTDPILTLCTTLTLASFYAAHVSEKKSGFALAAAVGAALGVLAKGLIGVLLPGLVGVLFLLLKRDWATMRAFLRPLPIAAFLVVAVPWFVLVARANPEFLWFFFIHEHIGRYAAEVGHPEGPWYYLPVLLLGPLPWTPVAIGLAFSSTARRAFGELPSDGRTFLLVWALSIIIFFWLATTKLAPYVLPAFPPLALLAGAWIDRVLEQRPGVNAVYGLALGLLGLGLAMVAIAVGAWGFEGPIARGLSEDAHDVGTLARAATRGGAIMVLTVFLATRRSVWERAGSAGVLAIVTAGFCLSMLGAVGARAVAKNSRELAHAIQQERVPGDLLVSYHKFMHGLNFYTGSRVALVKNYDEIKAGRDWAPDRAEYFWDRPDRLVEEWGSGRRVFLTTDAEKIPELTSMLQPPPRVVVRDRRRVLLVNFAAADKTAPDAPGGDSGSAVGDAGTEAGKNSGRQG